MAIQYLWQLPAAKDVDAYFHSARRWVENGSRIGTLQTAGGMPVMLRPWKTLDPHGKTPSYAATWPRAVVGTAFGGLVPQASSLVVDAVAFTVGGTGLRGCLYELENLLNDLHELDEGPDEAKLAVYGEMVHQRCQMRAWIESLDDTLPMRWSTPKAALIFHRYMTLIEAMAARCGRGGATRAVIVDDSEIVEQIFVEAHALVERTYTAAVKSHLEKTPVNGAPDWKLSSEERELLGMDYGQALGDIRSRVNAKPEEVSVSDCAIVVRCILAAWASQVPMIRWKDEEMSDSELGPLSALPSRPHPRRLALLGDLPQVAGLG